MIAVPLQVNPCNVGAVSSAENHNVSHESELLSQAATGRTTNMTYSGAEPSGKIFASPMLFPQTSLVVTAACATNASTLVAGGHEEQDRGAAALGPTGCRMRPGNSPSGRTKNWGTVRPTQEA